MSIKHSTRLLNKLFEDKDFLVDKESVPYIVRDIINMNWWNTCNYMLGYQKNKRVNLDIPTYRMKVIAVILKEFYRHNQSKYKDKKLLIKELKGYIEGNVKQLRQLRLYSIDYRRNDSQFFYKDGKCTWLDCTSRATYAWKYVGQNGYIDFNNKCVVEDAELIIDHCKHTTVYPYKKELLDYFQSGINKVKKEIFSQRNKQYTVKKWVKKLNIKVIPSRKWLFDLISHVRTDPYKNNEKKLLKEGKLKGNNELLYGYKTNGSIITNTKVIIASHASCASCISYASRASIAGNASNASCISDARHASIASIASIASRASIASDASRASNASRASGASHASSASSASDTSRASGASHASCISDASRASSARHESSANGNKINNWFNVPNAIGKLKNLDHPPMFLKNKFATAGHWKINKDLIINCKLGWIDPFLGWGESPLHAKKMKKNYVGIEINKDAMKGYLLPYVQKAVNKYGDKKTKVELRLGDSMKFYPDLVKKFDLCYTSPPYFKFEDNGFHNKVIQDCIDYDEYHERVTKPVFKNVYKYLVKDGILALQTEKDNKLKLKWINAIESIGFKLINATITGQAKIKYSKFSKSDQNLLIFVKVIKRKVKLKKRS